MKETVSRDLHDQLRLRSDDHADCGERPTAEAKSREAERESLPQVSFIGITEF